MTRATLYVLLPISIVAALVLVSQGVDPELPPVHRRQDGRRRDADDRAGTSRLAGSHQAARHERRRLLQRQLRAPVREPDTVHQSRSDPVDLRPRRRADLHVRPHGQGHASGLGALLGDGGDVPDGRVRRLSGRAGRQSDPREARRREPRRPATQSGGNMEGKETRFGIAASALFATVTTDASCGAVNSWHDSFTPLGGLVPMFNMQTDEVIFGGVGAGLYGMLLYAIVGVFIAGLMVGRTPEYIGKKIQQKEVKMALLAILATAFLILVFSGHQRRHAIRQRRLLESARPGDREPQQRRTARVERNAVRLHERRRRTTAARSPALRSIRRGTTSRCGLCMLFGRFLFIIPALAIAGSLASKKVVPTLGRHAADARPPLRRPARRHGHRRRRADVLPGVVARADCRALPDARGHSSSRRCSCRSRSGVKPWPPQRHSADASADFAAAPVDERA